MTKLVRAQISRSVILDPAQGVFDTTVKLSRGPWRALAPTWDMVLGHKAGRVSDAQYTSLYVAILNRAPEALWTELATWPVATVCCFCRDTWFCHTQVLIEYAIRRWPERFEDGRPTSQFGLVPAFEVPVP